MKEWTRRYYIFRYIYSRLVINIVSNHPLTAMFAPLLFIGGKQTLDLALVLFTATMYTEYNLTSIPYLISIYQCYANLKKDITNQRFGKLEQIESEIIQQLADAAIRIEGNPLHKQLKPIINIYRASKFQGYTTFPIYPRTTVIILKSSFNEDFPEDRAALAHECGHAFHSIIRNKKYKIAASSILLLIILTVYALCYNNWWGFLTMLFLAYPIFIDIFRYEADIETEADEAGLKIIESIYGVHEMRRAAKHLVRVRIEEARENNNNINNFTIKASIAHYLRFLEAKDLDEFIIDSYDANKDLYLTNEDIVTKRKKEKFEFWLRTYLKQLWHSATIKKSPVLDSSLKSKYIKNGLYIICVSMGILIPGLLTYIIFSNPNNLATFNSPLLRIIHVAIISTNFVLSIIIYFLTTTLWKKIEYLFNLIGN